MTPYLEALRLMMFTITSHQGGVIVGQSVLAGGTSLRRTTDHLPDDKLIEFPVMEDSQLGYCIGLSLAGYLPVCCYPRWSFAGLAFSQLVHHLDKIPEYGNGYKPRVLVRVAVPCDDPLDPGPQHLGDFSAAFRMMLRNTPVIEMHTAQEVRSSYERVLSAGISAVMVEYTEKYDK